MIIYLHLCLLAPGAASSHPLLKKGRRRRDRARAHDDDRPCYIIPLCNLRGRRIEHAYAMPSERKRAKERMSTRGQLDSCLDVVAHRQARSTRLISLSRTSEKQDRFELSRTTHNGDSMFSFHARLSRSHRDTLSQLLYTHTCMHGVVMRTVGYSSFFNFLNRTMSCKTIVSCRLDMSVRTTHTVDKVNAHRIYP